MKTNKLLMMCLAVLLVLTAAVTVGVKPASAAITETQKLTVENFELDNVSAMLGKHLSGVDYQEVKAINPDQKVDVIVELKGSSLLELAKKKGMDVVEYADSEEGKAIITSMMAEQNKIMKAIKDTGKEVKFEYTYTTLNYGIAVNLRYGDIKAISKVEGIKRISLSEVYESPKTATSAIQMNLDVARKDYGYTGKGMVVAIV
ncbi:MAG: hypothetical protein RR054_06060, partial [Clostridia bacterium]